VEAGADVATVLDQRTRGATDAESFRVCAAERRTLVTLDVDFADPFRFDPAATAGVAVPPPGRRAVHEGLRACSDRLVQQLQRSDIQGRLWVVDPDRVRQHEPGAADSPYVLMRCWSSPQGFSTKGVRA